MGIKMQQFDFILAINRSFNLECFIFNILQIILLLAQIFLIYLHQIWIQHVRLELLRGWVDLETISAS